MRSGVPVHTWPRYLSWSAGIEHAPVERGESGVARIAKMVKPEDVLDAAQQREVIEVVRRGDRAGFDIAGDQQ